MLWTATTYTILMTSRGERQMEGAHKVCPLSWVFKDEKYRGKGENEQN